MITCTLEVARLVGRWFECWPFAFAGPPAPQLAQQMSQLTGSEYAVAFRLLDDFSRSKHRCFLAELFPNEARSEYVLCFRPLTISKDLSDPMMAYRYLHIGVIDLRVMAASRVLPVLIAEKLDQELRSLA